MHIGQAEVAALVKVSQAFVVNALQAQLEINSTLADTPAMSVTAIQSEVLNLSATDRARLLDVIWESLSKNTVGIYGDLSGVVKLQKIDSLELSEGGVEI